MRNVAKLGTADLSELFVLTADKMKLSPAIIEKDFWVCWMLDYIFTRSPWKHHLAFKGGTSLSKAYGIIKRFSEDIDLILDWRLLGYGLNEPWEPRSNTQQDIFNGKAIERSAAFLKNTFVPIAKDALSKELGLDINLTIDGHDSSTVIFNYPCAFRDASILREIRLESGALAAWTPASNQAIRSYAAQWYPQLFAEPETMVYTVDPERTFWEKVTILHREAMRTPERGRIQPRYSRHYYDLWCMSEKGTKNSALRKSQLLEEVVSFKRKFYRCSWAHYEQATINEIRLMPPDESIRILTEDYRHMQNMIFGHTPTFDEILDCIRELEQEIHAIRSTL